MKEMLPPQPQQGNVTYDAWIDLVKKAGGPIHIANPDFLREQHAQGVSPVSVASDMKATAGKWGKQRFSSTLIAGIVIGIVSGSYATLTISEKKSYKGPDSGIATASQDQVFDKTVEEIISDFDEYLIKSSDWYPGKTIRVRARIGYITQTEDKKNVVIVFRKEKPWILDPTIQFWYGEPFRQKLSELREGQIITVTGEFVEESGFEFKFKGKSISQS